MDGKNRTEERGKSKQEGTNRRKALEKTGLGWTERGHRERKKISKERTGRRRIRRLFYYAIEEEKANEVKLKEVEGFKKKSKQAETLLVTCGYLEAQFNSQQWLETTEGAQSA